MFSGLVLRRAQTLTVTGSDTENASITGSATFTVTPGAADHIAFNVPATVMAGESFAITATVQDAYSNTVSDYTGTVHFTLTGPATAMADYTFTTSDIGSHTFGNLILSQTGMYTLTGTDMADSMLTGAVMFMVM
jgi:hypothetical protein